MITFEHWQAICKFEGIIYSEYEQKLYEAYKQGLITKQEYLDS